MTDRLSDDRLEPTEGAEDGPGSDPGMAYQRAVEEGEAEPAEDDAEPDPGIGDVYRSGS